MSAFVQCKVVEAKAKVAAIVKLGTADVRAAHRLLIACATKLLNFLAATVPPSVSLPHLLDFDNCVQDAFLGLLGFVSGSCSREREFRAILKLSLPSPHGCALFKSFDYASIAWWNSVANCLSDPLLFKLREGLSSFVHAAHLAFITVLGGVSSRFWSSVQGLFPNSALA
jgi:hypothetical protein